MAWTIEERFPSWGETGSMPAAGFFYEGGDQVNEKHMDALWDGLNGLEEDVQAALNDIDSDADGVVDKADGLAAGATLDGDLSATNGEVIWDESATYIPQPRLQNDSVTVAGNAVSLGDSTGIALGDLSNVTATGEGSGNGFNADTVDGKEASDLGKTTEEVQDDVGAMVGYGLEYDDANDVLSKTRQGPNPYDAAQTFAESDLSLTTTDCSVSNGSIVLSYIDITDTGGQASDSPAVGDVTGDGQADIVFVDTSDNLKYYDVANGTVTDTGGQASGLAVGDVTGDGQADIAFVDTSSNLKYYDVANGTVTDTGEQANVYYYPAVGDVTGDGQADIAFVDTSDNLKYYDVANGTVTDTGKETYGSPAVGDVTGDGQADIAFVDTSDNVKYYDVANGTVTDTGKETYGSPAVGDVTGDGQADIVFRDTSDNLKYYDVANGTVTDTGEQTYSVAVGDVTGDGQADIAFVDTSSNLKYYDVANGTVTDTGEQVYNSPAVGDVTGDGQADIAFRDTSDNLKYYAKVASTSGTATVEWPYPSDIYEWDVATFTRTLDNETVDVYVAYNDGNGWTRTNGGNPITRNYSLADDSNIDASTEVRFEVELSRADTANNPTLDSAIRSWFI